MPAIGEANLALWAALNARSRTW